MARWFKVVNLVILWQFMSYILYFGAANELYQLIKMFWLEECHILQYTS